MTYNPMQSVTEFHDKFHRDGKGRHEIYERPISIPAMELIERRRLLITEEFHEVEDVLGEYENWIYFSLQGLTKGRNVTQIRADLAKELADLLYVIYGTAEELRIPIEEVFKAVHESNMSKLWPDGTVHYNDFGKVIKPPTYSPPDIEKILYGE